MDTKHKTFLAMEFAAIFVGIPLFYRFLLTGVKYVMIPFLMGMFVLCLILYLRDKTSDRKGIFRLVFDRRHAAVHAGIFAVSVAVLFLITWYFLSERLFWMPKNHPLLMIVLSILYPLMSVIPQEFIYRTFMFHRYRGLVPAGWPMVFASAAMFSLMHVVFCNWQAPALTFLGGILFSVTYRRTGSLAVTIVEHSLYGILVFVLGLGIYFYGGSISLINR